MFFTARSTHISTVCLCFILYRRVLLRHVYMVLCTVHVEDTPGINSCRSLRESFCAYCDIIPEQCRTSQPSEMTLLAQQNRVFLHFPFPLLITISPCFVNECILDGFVVCDDDDLVFLTLSFGVLVRCSTSSNAPTCSTGVTTAPV
jgi:hypothetical protein